MGRRHGQGLGVRRVAREHQAGVPGELAVGLGDDVPTGLRDTGELGLELLGRPWRIAGEQLLLE